MVPSSRLLFWILVVAFPASLLGGLLPVTLPWVLGILIALALLCAADLVISLNRLRGFAVEFADVIRLSKDQQGSIDVRIHNDNRPIHPLRIGLPLPRQLRSEHETMVLRGPPAGNYAEIAWPVRPVRRGNYRLDECFIETPSALGFWEVRGKLPASGEIRVYPNLLQERKHLASLFLNRGGLGIHTYRQLGKGHEFEKLRDYVPGDNYEDIHWKATARRARPITKTFQVERTQEVYVIIDASRLSAREVDDTGARLRASAPGADQPIVTMLERFIRSGLILGLVAERQSDHFGMLTFSDRVESFVRASSGKAHYGHCRDALYTLESRRVAPDFDELFRFIRLRMHRRALLIFLTSLDDPALAESFLHNVDLICRRHILLVNMMAPVNARPLFSSATVNSTDEVYRSLGGHLLWENLGKVESSLRRKGVKFSLLGHEMMTPELVAQYLNVKQRQLL